MTSQNCGCCALPPQTPLEVTNRPGLSAIVFRAGTYGTFRLSMLQRIARTPALSALQTRSDDDYAITLIDMWATVADILTFYQERIANEGFLRTARLRDSVLRMARLLDYQLRPGVAAATLLAFTLDKDASLVIPVGLRVQSVPSDSEKPQIFETLESISADSLLNRVRVVPALVGVNPLAAGTTSAILAPGPEGLDAAASLNPNTRLLVWSGTEMEELAVRSLRVDEDRVVLTWSGPVQHPNWTLQSPVAAAARTFRIFGHNAPASYMEPVENPPGHFIWTQRKFTTYAYPPLPGGRIELDAKYEGIAAGTELLISEPGKQTPVTVTAVSQGRAQFLAPGSTTTPVLDTVTLLTIVPAPSIGDRRQVVVHELKGAPIRFWGYRYGDAVAGATLYIPARRVDAQTAEIGRTIQKNAYTPGGLLPLPTVDAGRKLLLLDGAQGPVAAVVTAAAIVATDVHIEATADDPATASALQLDPETGQSVAGLISAPLPASLTFQTAKPEIGVTVGSLPARTIKLPFAPATPAQAAAQLQAMLGGSAPAVPEFAHSIVLTVGSRLQILAGVPGADVIVTPTAGDPNSAVTLGLAAPGSRRVVTLLSGPLPSPIVLSNPLRQFSIAIGPSGPFTVSLGATPGNPTAAASLLQSALQAADVGPYFSGAQVLPLGSRLLILPGIPGARVQEYLAIAIHPDSAFRLDPASAVLLGNIAQASHGETVAGEVMGDGDLSQPFQKFELEKKPLTYTPSAGPGGAQSTLRVLVSDVLWSEAPTLFGKAPTDQVYTTRLADDGTVTVGFGDGATGARLPSGRGNVLADYRQGSGLQGRVLPLSLRSPLDLPVGLKSVTNPAAATGGADPESLAQARQNAPTTVRTFGRAVSLADFEDLARASGEVAKALATWVWNGETRIIHLTIAAQKGQLFTKADLARIYASLNAGRDPNHILLLANFVPVPVVVSATVRVNPARIARKVAAAVRAALLDALSFDALRFGEPLAVSEIYRVLQEAPGVDSVDINLFQFKNRTPAFLTSRGATADPVQRSLRIFAALPNPGPPPPAVLPAEIAFLETPAEDIQIVTAGGLPE
ncbi:MAG TPA: baseplate J/gp47 family protein [Candidatus Acidoferrales bacterium]|jgi:hypothetical protein|nr:baseplate J/gp47 family protein [Candidatus Acidoferrales bacterium]